MLKKRRDVLTGLLLSANLITIAGCIVINTCGNSRSFDHRGSKHFESSLPIALGSTLFADLTHTDIIVIGSDTSECKLSADMTVYAVSEDVLSQTIEQLEVKLVEQNGRIEIVVNKPQSYLNDYSVSGKMTINVPAQTRTEMATTHGDCGFENIQLPVKIGSTHGNLKFDGIGGDIAAKTTHGNIDAENIKTVLARFETTHGNVSLNSCAIRSVNCTTTHGPIRLNTVSTETLNLQTSHDPIELVSCISKEAKLTTSHGPIVGDISDIQRLAASTSHDPIRLRCVNAANPNILAQLNTTFGNIEFTPPAGFAGTVSVSTSYGSIHSDLPIVVQGAITENKISGIVGQGTGSISLTTTHGKIALKAAKQE